MAYDTRTTSNAANRDYAVPVYAALASDVPFGQVSSGFAGTAGDGLTQLDTSHSLTATFDSAANGNVVQVASESTWRTKTAETAETAIVSALGFDRYNNVEATGGGAARSAWRWVQPAQDP